MGTHPIFESDFDCLTECFVVEFSHLVDGHFRHPVWQSADASGQGLCILEAIEWQQLEHSR